MRFRNFSTYMHRVLAWLLIIILHPLTIAACVTLLVFLIAPNPFPRFIAEVDESHTISPDGTYNYEDLNGDGISEKIVTQKTTLGIFGVAVYENGKYNPKQWNFSGESNFTNFNSILFGDYDGNGIKEVYVFTVSTDSIFIHIIPDYREKGDYSKTGKFISPVGLRKGKHDAFIVPGKMDDLNNDGKKELIFGISTGFSTFPRGIFAWDIQHDSILRSPESYAYFSEIKQIDVTGDGKAEIIQSGYAPSNISDTTVKYHDRSVWLMVYDRNLNFLFEPVEFKAKFPGLTYAGVVKDTNPILCMKFSNGYDTNIRNPQLLKFNSKGKLVEKPICLPADIFLAGDFFSRTDKKGQSFYFMQEPGKGFHQFNDHFQYDCLIPTDYFSGIMIIKDITGDTVPEFIHVAPDHGTITIFTNEFNQPVTLRGIIFSDPAKVQYSVIREKEKTFFLIHSGNTEYKILYKANPLYLVRFGLWIATFFVLYLFILLIMKIQRFQINKKLATEKKITELQLKIVRNQMDPHFTMNAINSVIEAIRREEKEAATQSLLHFSKIYRSLVLSGDKIKRSLAEELDFSKNYLELEKFRFQNHFDYQLAIDPDVDLGVDVPKMIIQSSVENAVKHGLLNKESGGMLVIRASLDDHQLLLEVEDNGVGRHQAAGEGSTGTGRGLKIMEEFLELYHKITGIRIQWQVNDLFEDSGLPAGTRVTISLPDVKR